MKSRITLSFVICTLLLSLWACNTDTTGSEAKKSDIAKEESHTLYEIDRDTALLAINSYEGYINSVIDTLSKAPTAYPEPEEKLIYGVQVNRKELYEILEARPLDSLYVMIGTKSDGETEFFFGFKSKPNIHDQNPINNWDFFDFTRPCPNACPDFVMLTQ